MSTQLLTVDYVNKKEGCDLHIPITMLQKPSNEKEYRKQHKLLDKLFTVVGNNEKHPLIDVVRIISNNIEDYDDESHPPIGANLSHVDIVKFLMANNNLTQKDLADVFGGQGNVSRFLKNERSLNLQQIKKLADRFSISSDIFFNTKEN